MKKKWNLLLGTICYALGVFFTIYIGGWVMLIQPIRLLMTAFTAKTLTFAMLVTNIVKIALSTTVGGFLWCLGYIGFNHFRGTEEPDWEQLEKKKKEGTES